MHAKNTCHSAMLWRIRHCLRLPWIMLTIGNVMIAYRRCNTRVNINMSDSLFSTFKHQPKILISFLAACAAMMSAGTYYSFPLFGPHLATRFGYSMTQVNFIAAAGDYGVYICAPLFGFLVDRTGSRLAASLAALMLFSGYALMSITVDGIIPHHHYLLLALYFAMVGVGSSAAYMAALSATARNFPSNIRGSTLGIAIGLFGLSAFLISRIDAWFFIKNNHVNTAGLLWALAVICSLLNVFALFGLGSVKQTENITSSLAQETMDASSDHENSSDVDETTPFLPENNSNVTGFHGRSNSSQSGSYLSVILSDRSNQRSDVDTSFGTFLKDKNAWMLFLILIFTSGAGLEYINNIGYMVSRVAFSSGEELQTLVGYHVACFSLASFSSRVVVGIGSDWSIRRYLMKQASHRLTSPAIRRPRQCGFGGAESLLRLYWIALVVLTLAVGLFLAAYMDSPSFLYFATAMVGIGYGGMFTLCPALVSEWWGSSQFGRNWGSIALSPAVGSVVFNTLFGVVVEQQGGSQCHLQSKCYRTALVISSAGSFLALILVVVIRRNKSREFHPTR